MNIKQYVAYYRVSTQKQGNSGLGLEAQEHAVIHHLKKSDCELVASFTEIETGKGTNALNKRPQLRNALDLCRKTGATLIIAKLDRLARNVHFVTGLLETGCDFIAADMPHADKVMLQIYSVMAEWERDQISIRTKAALMACKSRGVKLGVAGKNNLRLNIQERKNESLSFANNLTVVLNSFKSANLTQRQIVNELNLLGIKAARGGSWKLNQLQRVLTKIN